MKPSPPGSKLLLLVLVLAAPPAAAAPVVLGQEPLAGERAGATAAGALLLGELGCVACHRPEPAVAARLPAREAPRLDGVGARATPEYLRRFLADPAATKPGTTMPSLLAAWPAHERGAAVDRLVHYLVSLGGPLPVAGVAAAADEVDRGRNLFHSIGCVACHGPEPEPGARAAAGFVPLGDLAARTTVGALAAFLRAPAKARPAGRMPDFRLSEGEAHALAVYLLRGQVEAARAQGRTAALPGVDYAYFETEVGAAPPPWQDLAPQRRGHLPELGLPPDTRADSFAVRFEAQLQVPRAGRYTFHTESDDGSELFVGGKRVVENHGQHPMQRRSGSVDLEAGSHALVVGYWQVAGDRGLKVSWEGPGVPRGPIPTAALSRSGGVLLAPLGAAPFTVDRAKAEEGRRLFASVGCASCHAVEGTTPAPTRAPPLAQLAADARRGCLAEAPARNAPWFALDEGQRTALAATLARKAELGRPLPPAGEALLHLARRGCLACHRRDGLGGPPAALDPLFETTSDVDLGDEGRLPPPLDGVGSKLKPGAFERIVLAGELHVRPYMATRMPTFPRDPGFAAMTGALVAADGRPDDAQAAPLDPRAAQAGRRLAGTSPEPSHTGLGCINCHNVAGTPATGAPGPDLALAAERLNPGWFRRWLANPNTLREGTRMPAFWGDDPIFPEVEGGDGERQRAALWAYVSLGRSMPLPSGMVVKGAERELVPADGAIVYRTYARGAGPRAVVVGYPEQVHVAFDANVVRLARAWRGRFWDASGTWTGRSGNFNTPLGTDVLDLPPGPALAVLPEPAAPWPRPDLLARDVGGRFGGYRLDAEGRPTFLYRLAGLRVEELPRPAITATGVALVRRFTLAGRPPPGLHLLAAAGRSIEPRGPGAWSVDGKLTVVLRPALAARVREGGGGQELVVPVPPGTRTVELELQW